jgi:hypothetical protein
MIKYLLKFTMTQTYLKISIHERKEQNIKSAMCATIVLQPYTQVSTTYR